MWVLLILLLVLIIVLWSKAIAAFLEMDLVFLIELFTRDVPPRMVLDLLAWTIICIMLTHIMVRLLLVVVCPRFGFPSICSLTLRDPRLGHLVFLMCRYRECGLENMDLKDSDLLLHHVIGTLDDSPPSWWPPRGMCFHDRRLHLFCELSYTFMHLLLWLLFIGMLCLSLCSPVLYWHVILLWYLSSCFYLACTYMYHIVVLNFHGSMSLFCHHELVLSCILIILLMLILAYVSMY